MNDQGKRITESEMERLSLIRYQLLSASEALKQPAPVNSLSINIMQDTVEAALGAVGEHVSATVKAKSEFDKLFDAVVAELGNPPELTGLRAPAIALNNARVGFKHHGNQVRDETLRRHLDVTTTLVQELILHGFGTPLDEVSMLLFVRHEGVRAFIEKSENLARENKLVDALSYLRSAFNLVVHDYMSRKSLDGWRSIFDVKPTSFHHLGIENWGWEKPLEEVREWVGVLDERVRLMSVGVDLSRYARFDAVAPHHSNMWHSGRGPIVKVNFNSPTDEHYSASHLFVLDTAIKLSVNDFNLETTRVGSRPAEAFDPEFKSEQEVNQ